MTEEAAEKEIVPVAPTIFNYSCNLLHLAAGDEAGAPAALGISSR